MSGRLLILLSAFCLNASPAIGAPERSVLVTADAQTNLRELARSYLQDPNAWPEILRASGLNSVDQVRPGVRLEIPVREVLDLSQSMSKLRELIYRATAIGAQILATQAINEAIAKQADSIEAQRDGRLADAADMLRAGIDSASRALAASQESRDAAAQAILDASRGRVQRRRPDEFDWTAIPVKTLLAELERIRTLSRSSALVRFRDASSLSLSENAQLAIRRLRRDELTSREQVDVVLYSGDVRALIESGGGREAVNVQVPGIETGIRSNHYWLQKAGQTTRLANYEGEIELRAGGDTVVVRENQGTLVGANARPKPPVNLLPAPALAAPTEGQRVFDSDVELNWQPVERAAAYWLEVARDRQFADLALTETGLSHGRYRFATGEGVYYWRVSAVDEAGLPGPASDGRSFQVLRDTLAPFVVVTSPAQDRVMAEPRATLTGQVEEGAQLRVDGVPVEPRPDGTFSLVRSLAEGENLVVLEARDAAGNRSPLEWRLHYHPRAGLPLRVGEGLPKAEDGTLLVNHTPFALTGNALPQADVRVTGPGVSASATADARGRFGVTLPARTEPITLVLSAKGPLGQVAELPLKVLLDQEPPKIRIDAQPPERTAKANLTFSGQVENGTVLEHAGRRLPLGQDGRFVVQVALAPGENLVSLRATDAAGNASEWRSSIRLDARPPVLDASKAIETRSKSGRQVLVEIQAHDESGMTAGIPYRLSVGDLVVQGTASRCPDRTCYRDQVSLPASVGGRPKLQAVTLQDYLGNRQEMHFE